MKREYVPILERQQLNDFDDRLEQQRKSKRDFDKEYDEINECTFDPRISKTYDTRQHYVETVDSPRSATRCVEDLYEWEA